MWKARNLYQHTPESSPYLTFYYVPLRGTQQILLRRKYSDFDTMFSYMKTIISQRLLMFQVFQGDDSYLFLWPSTLDEQEALFENIPRNVIMSTGASILGWRRIPQEGSQQFVDRIIIDLKNSLLP